MARIAFLLTATPWSDRRQFFRQAPALAQAGHDVVYIAGKPDRAAATPFRTVPLAKRRKKFARLTGALSLLPLVLSLKPDAIQLCSVEQLPLGLMLKLFSRIRVVYDCREDMYHSFRDSKVWLPFWLRRILSVVVRGIENAASRTFDGMIVSDPALYQIHSGMPERHKIIFYNTPLLSQFSADYAPIKDRPYDMALLGGMSRRSGFMVLTEAIRLWAERGRRLRILLIGQPDDESKQALDGATSKLDLSDSVTLTGTIPHDEVPAYLKQARIGLVLLLDMPKYRHNIACKAFEYMACGMPSVCSDLPPQRIMIRDGETGLFFKPGDPNDLAKAVESLLNDLPRADRMGQKARQDAETQWNCEKEQEKLVNFYNSLLNSTSHSPPY